MARDDDRCKPRRLGLEKDARLWIPGFTCKETKALTKRKIGFVDKQFGWISSIYAK